jgi:hypothetical protein
LKDRPVKRIAIIGAAVLAIVGLMSFVAASERGSATMAESVPADEVLVIVSEMGLRPSTRVRQEGAHYIVQAVDPRGRMLRVVADVRSGTILSVMPLQESARYVPVYSGGARIIQVPQADEGNEIRTLRPARETGVKRAKEEAAAVPPRRMTSAPPPPPARPRTMLNSPDETVRALTPIYPTPRFETGTEATEKFDPDGGGQSSPTD